MVLIHLSCNVHIISIIIAVIFYHIFRHASSPKHVNLVIGILSRYDNFEQRDTIRKTWLKYIDHIEHKGNARLKAFFIVGKQCPIPPEYRDDPYSCHSLKLYPQKDLSKAIQAQTITRNTYATKMGMLCSLLSTSNSNNTRIYLVDARNNVIFEVPVNNYEISGPFCFVQTSHHIQLSQGFVAAIKINISQTPEISCEFCPKWDEQTSLIVPKNVYHDFNGFKTSRFEVSQIIPVTFEFRLADIASYITLRDKTNETYDKFLDDQRANEKLLETETKQGDIVLLDVVDTYRNLTEKMINFMKWLESNYNYDYLLKTDDDSYLDLIAITEDLSFKQFGERTWWGNFRFNWVVNLYGKWADPDYPSPVYPAFACGSGYVFSYDIVSWILHNSENLHRYQGEDVSMGIWLSSILPSYENDDNWFCDIKDAERINSYSVGQLNVSSLVETYYRRNAQRRYEIVYYD